MLSSTLKSPWFWLAITFLCLLVIISSLILKFNLFNSNSFVLIGPVIAGFSSLVGTLVKFHSNFKQHIQEIKLYVEKAMLDIKQNTDEKIGKANSELAKKQIEYQNNSSEFLLDTLIKVERNILEEVRRTKNDIAEQFEQMDDKLSKVSNDVSKLQDSVFKMEECKTKKEFWAKEFEKDWDGCKAHIKLLNDESVYSGAVVIKEEFMDFVNDILAWDLCAESASEKEIIINRIVEKFDAMIASLQRQLITIIKPKHYEQYILLNKPNELSFKIKIEKSFHENIINNVYKNTFNFSSQYLNETLNTYVAAYLKSINSDKL